MSGAPGPFEQVYADHVVGIYRFIFARVGNRPDAEDLTAQVFIRAVEHLDTAREPRQITAWLYRVAQNAIADHWRAFYRLPLVGMEQVAPGWEPADGDGRPALPPDDSSLARVHALLGRLPDRYRRVLELRFLQRMSVAETATAMGITSGNAKVLQYRALRRAALLEEGRRG